MGFESYETVVERTYRFKACSKERNACGSRPCVGPTLRSTAGLSALYARIADRQREAPDTPHRRPGRSLPVRSPPRASRDGGRGSSGGGGGGGGGSAYNTSRRAMLVAAAAGKLLGGRYRFNVGRGDAGRAEARCLRLLNSCAGAQFCGVVRLETTFTHRGHCCLVLELHAAPLLRHVTPRDEREAAPLPVPAVRALAMRLLSGLVLLEQEGIVHGNLKPDNVLLSTAKEGSAATATRLDALLTRDRRGAVLGELLVTLCGFGHALHRSEARLHYENFDVQTTLAYRAPEVLHGCPFGPPADAYSLGVLLLEAVLGRPLFRTAASRAGLAIQTACCWLEQAWTAGAGAGERCRERCAARCRRGGVDGTAAAVTPGHIRRLLLSRAETAALPRRQPHLVLLLRGLLEPDPDRRLTPQQALAHAFFGPAFPFGVLMSGGSEQQRQRLEEQAAQLRDALRAAAAAAAAAKAPVRAAAAAAAAAQVQKGRRSPPPSAPAAAPAAAAAAPSAGATKTARWSFPLPPPQSSSPIQQHQLSSSDHTHHGDGGAVRTARNGSAAVTAPLDEGGGVRAARGSGAAAAPQLGRSSGDGAAGSLQAHNRTLLTVMSPQQLREKQETDEFAGRIIRCLLGTTDERDEGVASCIAPEELVNFNFNCDGVLTRCDAAGPSAADGGRRHERQRLVLPQELQSTALRSAHDGVVGGGHMGYESTLIELQHCYYWPSLKRDVRRWCRAHPRHWYRLLLVHACAANCAYQCSIKKQRLCLMYGHTPELPIDQILGVSDRAAAEEQREQQLALQWAPEAATLKGEAVQEGAAASEEANAQLRSPQVHSVGDSPVVWVACTPETSLELERQGYNRRRLRVPTLEVVRVPGPACVEIEKSDTGAIQRLNVALAKPFTAQQSLALC
ncbi:hypothetical protein JKP88DRAFT_296103 [Tribonema minus]|uniref:Protein kinase domain-containing protein n=1 Tax=Tribonema minus TaxID=303371 RepID=A0A835ZFW0_9STRA|nr:hypothetical protein JKP88DRAFT_296103 [Tribonema minus]